MDDPNFRCRSKVQNNNGIVFRECPQIFMAYPIRSMYGIYANIGGILMANVTIYSIHGSYGYYLVVHRRSDPVGLVNYWIDATQIWVLTCFQQVNLQLFQSNGQIAFSSMIVPAINLGDFPMIFPATITSISRGFSNNFPILPPFFPAF